MCGYYPQPIMDKTNYKFQLTYPVAQTTKIVGDAVANLLEEQHWDTARVNKFPFRKL